MRGRSQESLTRVGAAVIAMTAAAIGFPIGVADAREAADADFAFKTPDETRLFGREVPDVALRFADGHDGRLSDLWADRPVFLSLVFSRCAGICSPYLGVLRDTVDQVGGGGDRYQMVVISFDARDRPEDMVALAKHHGLENDRGWTFAAPASSEELTALCESLDFDFRWDERRQQFDHPAITVALRRGKFVRLSVGGEITPGRFKDMLADARGEFVPIYPAPGERGALFRCFDYDPERGFIPNWGMLILVFPGVAALTVATLMFMAARVRAR
jgi:cytochrome oxidase Cu insertion factor (SCO1/SenC/PrrC family)